MSLSIDDILGPDGLLSQKLERYEFRDQQLEMARHVDRAIHKGRPLIVEAATGTGKTLAYLIPAIMSGKRVVVSTGTKALQEQIFFKDVPFLARHLPKKFEAVLLKGRRNYLCQLRFSQMKGEPRFRSREDAQHWQKVLRWAERTESGDRAEVKGLPDNWPTWNELSVGSEGCLGTKCPHAQECFVNRARDQAREANLIVVNHHLFFADLALRQEGFGEVLPEYDALIFDEAHHIEDVATEYFGLQVSNFRFTDLTGDIDRWMETEELSDSDIDKAMADVLTASEELFRALAQGLEEGRHALGRALEGPGREGLGEARRSLDGALDGLRRSLMRRGDLGEVVERFVGRCAEVSSDLNAIFAASDKRYAYMAEVRDSGVFLQAAPIDLGDVFRNKLFGNHDALVFTSATLTTGGNLDFFRQRLGLGKSGGEGAGRGPQVDELVLASVFDYQEQCVVYVPARLCAPTEPGFVENVAVIVEYLVGITEGRAFVLFTSHQNMRAVHEMLRDKLPYPTFLQGERPKGELLQVFKETPGAVLFATGSFWEGVDVVGDALSLVIIDKLPFSNPSDPLTRARSEMLDARGGSSFYELSVPAAALTLKQGVGRLIRSRADTGIVAILDSRIAHKSYGRYFLKTLPAAPVVWNASEVKKWWGARE